MSFSRITIVGVGLLGGSIGLALKAAGTRCKITGYGYRKESLVKALDYGTIDDWTLDLDKSVAKAQLVILCTPVGLFEPLLKQLRPLLPDGCVVTDVGSTKRTVVNLATQHLSDANPFVGSHPMAGSEKRGVEYARADLFRNATCIITPTASTPKPAADAIDGFWKLLGMRVARLSPEEHDAAVSDISHLPHVLAGALIGMQSYSAMPLAGKGFLDTTRIASGDALLWRDILLDNADNVKTSLDRLERQIAILRKLLSPDRSEALVQWLHEASTRRDHLVQQKFKEISGE